MKRRDVLRGTGAALLALPFVRLLERGRTRTHRRATRSA